MKKTCKGCRALGRNGCNLGHKTKVTSLSLNGFMPNRKPLENCKKPMTYKLFLKLKLLK